jgi:hypothetical protein
LRKAFGICSLLFVVAAPPAGAIELYATTATQGLYTIDTNTFAVNLVGNYTIPGSEGVIGGLAFDSNEILYGISLLSGAQLYTLNPANAFATLVGPLNAGFIFEGGLAFEPGTGVLYGVNQNNALAPHLMRINVATGQATVVGLLASGEHDFAGLAFDAAGQLYALDRPTNALWKIDKSNPSSALTGQVGAGLGSGIVMGNVGGMTNDSATGTYYGYAGDAFGGGSKHLFTVDLVTGAGTVLHQFTATDPDFYSLAYRDEKATVGVGTDATSADLAFSVHPNPSRGPTLVEYTLTSPATVRLHVLDIGGRLLASLQDGVQGTGTRTVRWNGPGGMTGVFFVRLQVGGRVLTRRAVRLE